MHDCDPLAWIWSIERIENQLSSAPQWNYTLLQFIKDIKQVILITFYSRYQTLLLIHATARPVSEGSISETKISYLLTVPDMIITDSRHCTSCIWRKHLWNQNIIFIDGTRHDYYWFTPLHVLYLKRKHLWNQMIIEKGHMHINRFFWSLLCYLFQTKFELVHSLTGNERDCIIYSP